MKLLARRSLTLSLAFCFSAALLRAHPGHDGHELTWDFSHLAEHPLVTLGYVAVVGLAGWTGWRLFSLVQSHSLRGSQARRGK